MNTPSYITELIADARRVDDLELPTIREAAQRGDVAALWSCEMIEAFKRAGHTNLSAKRARPSVDSVSTGRARTSFGHGSC